MILQTGRPYNALFNHKSEEYKPLYKEIHILRLT